MIILVILALELVEFTGLDNQVISVNPAQVVTVRKPRDITGDHISKDVKCLIHTTDGKVVTVIETCDIVRRRLNMDQE